MERVKMHDRRKKNGPNKRWRKGWNLKGKVSENPVNIVVQASKQGRSLRNLFQSLNEKNIPFFLWSIASTVGIIGTKYAMRPTGAGHWVYSQDNWHDNPKEKMKWSKNIHDSHATKPQCYFVNTNEMALELNYSSYFKKTLHL